MSSLYERFWKKVDVLGGNDCWIWTGARTDSGYGRIKVNGRYHRAHRVSYEMYIGPVPEGLFVCHHCDVPECVNPTHLFAGTPTDNMRDARSKDRLRGLEQPGEKNRSAKLTEDAVIEMRGLRADGGITVTELAKRFGVTHGQVSKILARKKWAHV